MENNLKIVLAIILTVITFFGLTAVPLGWIKLNEKTTKIISHILLRIMALAIMYYIYVVYDTILSR